MNPVCVGDWSPDFWVSFPCSHSECGHHRLLVAVLPIDNIECFNNHPSLRHAYSIGEDPQGFINALMQGPLLVVVQK